jgi:hypothetical protein
MGVSFAEAAHPVPRSVAHAAVSEPGRPCPAWHARGNAAKGRMAPGNDVRRIV